MPDLKLYVVPGSHPCHTVEAALRIKGLDYERVDLMFGAAPLMQQIRFGRRTVPGLTIGPQRVSGSRLIIRTLEGLRPEPWLIPQDTAERERMEELEEWGDFVFQEATRWIALQTISGAPEAASSYTAHATTPAIPDPVATRILKPLFSLERRVLGYSEQYVRDQVSALPAYVDRIDAAIADGVIGGEAPNAADLQLGSSLRLLLTFGDLAPLIEGRPCEQIARRWFADYPGHTPAGALPAEWVPKPAPVPAPA